MDSRGMLAALFLVIAIAFIPQDCHSANITRLDSTLRNYFSDKRHHSKNPDYKAGARDYIFRMFKEFDLQPQEQNFPFSNTTGSNIIGVLNGSNLGTADDRPVGVGAHYDTFDTSPGVNDNGSGMAALLEVARLLTDERKQGIWRKNTILFVAFDAEEATYAGSKQFKEGWLNPWKNRIYGKAASSVTLQGIIIMDTVMAYNESNNSQRIPDGMGTLFPSLQNNIVSSNYRGDFVLNIYRKVSDFTLGTTFTRAWKNLSKSTRIEEVPLPFSNVAEMSKIPGLVGLLRSDHSSLWEDNIPAIFLTDSADFRGNPFLKGCYHLPCDNIATMITDDNLKFLSTTTDAIVETLKTLSEQYECKPSNVGKRSIRDPVALKSTDVCKDTTLTPNGYHPLIPASIEWTMVLATIFANML